MTASGSAGDYYTISDGAPDGAGSEFYTYENGKNVTNLQNNAGFTAEQIRDMLTEAIALGCDGALLFSRGATHTAVISSNLVFYAEKLPTLEKRVLSVTDAKTGEAQPYTGGMSAGLGDVITYALDVTFYALENKKFSIDYTNVLITDEKTGNGPDAPIAVTPPTAAELQTMTDDRVVTETVQYTIGQEDVVRGAVVNEAQLAYQYKSLHSTGQLATTSDAQAEIRVHASVNYRYTSGTPGMELPAELLELTPADYTYYDKGTPVTVRSHPQSPFWDEANGGYWTLQNGGAWASDEVGSVGPDGSFEMSPVHATLTASWAFTTPPAIAVEKDGSLRVENPPDDILEGAYVDYEADYLLHVENTGGEPLTEFTLRDEALSEGVTLTAAVDGAEVTISPVYDPQSQSLSFILPGGLEPGKTLTLSYSCPRTGTLGYKAALTDESTAQVTARGGQTGVETDGEDDLAVMTTLETDIILTPADIVIYAGGAESGENVAPGTNLPEPGFFVVLPLAAERALRAEIKATEQVDLSPYLTFTDTAGNLWGLELFNEEYSKAHGSYLYRLAPKQVTEGGQTSIQMQFYDEEQGKNIIQSEFDITNALQQAYEMTIYPGEIPAVNPRAVLKVGQEEIDSYGLGVSPGRLIIRGATAGLTTSAIQSEEPEEVTAITARADSGVRYFINESELTVEPDNVALLVDDIVDEQYNQTLQMLAEPVLSGMENRSLLRYQFQYLDLVDTSMGNAWVTASQALEVLWPYPDGMGREDTFTILHYRGMDRDYDLEDMAKLVLGRDYTLEVYTTGDLPENAPSM